MEEGISFDRISQFSTMLTLIFVESDIHSSVSTVLRAIKVITTVLFARRGHKRHGGS
jgi:hypothetical protein